MTGRIFITTTVTALLAGFAIAQTAPGSAGAKPVGAKPARSSTPAAPAGPAAVAPKDKPAPKPAGDLITVTSTGGAEIEQKKNLMTYLKNVKFDHPTQNMVMECERLEVYREPPPPPAPKPTLAQEAVQGNKPPAPQQPDLKEAIATINVVIVKKAADGSTNIGRGQKAVFNGKTQEVLLSGNPSLEVGDNLFFSDKILLRENGKHELLGTNTRTVFKPKKNKGGAGGGPQP